jgi:hypothetical protein
MTKNNFAPQRSMLDSFARLISERTLRLLIQQDLIAPDSQNTPVFYAWSRPQRVVLVFDPLRLKRIEAVLSKRFAHSLSSALNGRRITTTNTRGVFLQVAYEPPKIRGELKATALELSQQPSPLHVPIGMTVKGPLWLSILEMDAVLVGGSRRMGKTRLLHGLIQALLHGDQAQLVLWDGKDNVEFGRYAAHRNARVIAELGAALQDLMQEITRRAGLFRQAGVSSLPEYNTRQSEKLPPLVLIIDEAAFIPETDQPTLINLVARGGAFGLHPIIATQKPDAQAVQTLVKANLSTRIALPVPTHWDSQVILGRPGAEKLTKVKGRLLLTWNARLVEVQSFIITLPEASAGESQKLPSLLSGEEIQVAHFLLTQDGWFQAAAVADAFGHGREWAVALGRRWEKAGYLTPVQRNEKGHPQGRKMTESLRQAAESGEDANQENQANLENLDIRASNSLSNPNQSNPKKEK